MEGRAGWYLEGQQRSSAWGWAGCHFWGGLGGSAVLPDTTRCLSAFAQRLCHGCCWERCAGDGGRRKYPLRLLAVKTTALVCCKRMVLLFAFFFFLIRHGCSFPFSSARGWQGLTVRAYGGGNVELFKAALSAGVSSV